MTLIQVTPITASSKKKGHRVLTGEVDRQLTEPGMVWALLYYSPTICCGKFVTEALHAGPTCESRRDVTSSSSHRISKSSASLHWCKGWRCLWEPICLTFINWTLLIYVRWRILSQPFSNYILKGTCEVFFLHKYNEEKTTYVQLHQTLLKTRNLSESCNILLRTPVRQTAWSGASGETVFRPFLH